MPAPQTAAPEATAAITEWNYCFAHERALEVERLPPSYLVLNLKVHVNYRNAGARPLIMPLGRDRTLYSAIKTGNMKILPQPHNFPDDQMPRDDEGASGRRKSAKPGGSA